MSLKVRFPRDSVSKSVREPLMGTSWVPPQIKTPNCLAGNLNLERVPLGILHVCKVLAVILTPRNCSP